MWLCVFIVGPFLLLCSFSLYEVAQCTHSPIDEAAVDTLVYVFGWVHTNSGITGPYIFFLIGTVSDLLFTIAP